MLTRELSLFTTAQIHHGDGSRKRVDDASALAGRALLRVEVDELRTLGVASGQHTDRRGPPAVLRFSWCGVQRMTGSRDGSCQLIAR